MVVMYYVQSSTFLIGHVVYHQDSLLQDRTSALTLTSTSCCVGACSGHTLILRVHVTLTHRSCQAVQRNHYQRQTHTRHEAAGSADG